MNRIVDLQNYATSYLAGLSTEEEFKAHVIYTIAGMDSEAAILALANMLNPASAHHAGFNPDEGSM